MEQEGADGRNQDFPGCCGGKQRQAAEAGGQAEVNVPRKTEACFSHVTLSVLVLLGFHNQE